MTSPSVNVTHMSQIITQIYTNSGKMIKSIKVE